ncbi:MAG: peptide ABC transporter substrate-binding protein [Chloroflexi bacterium]|nr:peptide ABC transporter substrate-binding protein [Chloroflexota bacterium]
MSRHIRWQAILALLGLLLIVALLSYVTYSYTTEYVPARGGVFVEGVAGNPQYINPLLCQYNPVDQDLCALVFNGLLKFDEHGNLQPDLAESWEASPASDVFTFTLRADARWHDGLRISADDVIYTVNLMQDPDLQVLPDLATLWRSVIAEAVDERTVVFRLSEPYAPFPDYTTIRWFGVIPKHYWQRYTPREMPKAMLNTQPIGSGPFRVTELDSQHIRLEPNLRALDTVPYLDALEFRFYPDYASILAAAEVGDVQGVSRVLPELLPQAEADPNLQLFTSPLSDITFLVLNVDTANAPFLQDVQVRQALAHAIDKQRLVDTILPGVGMVANSPLLPNSWAYDPDIATPDYDPTQAQNLLDEAGWVDSDGDGIRDQNGVDLEFVLLSDDAPHSQLISRSISDDLAKIGVRAVPQPVSFTGLVTDFLVPRNFSAALVNWEMIGDPDPYPLWHSTQESPTGQNYSGWNNRQADLAMEQARRTSDMAQRLQLYREFQTLFADDVPAIPLTYGLYTYAVSTQVKDVQVGMLNMAADRFQTFSKWYMLTRQVTLSERRTLQFDKLPK